MGHKMADDLRGSIRFDIRKSVLVAQVAGLFEAVPGSADPLGRFGVCRIIRESDWCKIMAVVRAAEESSRPSRDMYAALNALRKLLEKKP